MKFKFFALAFLISASLCLSSCSLFFTTVDVETNLDTDVKVIDTIDTTDTTANNIADILPENLAAVPGAEELIIGDNPEFHELNEGNVIAVWDDKNAWIFDLKLNRITPIVDYDAMLAAADTAGRGGEYFEGDLSLSLDFPYANEISTRIVLNVTAGEDCEYSVYTFYSTNDDNDNGFEKRGHLSGYYYESITYPGSDEPVYITNIDDYAKLGISDEIAENDMIFNLTRAIVENDVDSMKSIICSVYSRLKPELFDAWEGMEISEYSVYRMPPFTPYLNEIMFNMKIEKSDVEALPPGEYYVRIGEGIGLFVDIKSISDLKAPVETEAANWISPFVRVTGSFKPEDMVVTNENYVHVLLDSVTWYYTYESPIDLNSFAEYCEKYFSLDDVEKHYTNGYVTGHGGHGRTSSLCKIREDSVNGKTHIITADFFADPMATVIARTYEYTLIDIGNGEFRLDGVTVTYDSGYGIYGWSA